MSGQTLACRPAVIVDRIYLETGVRPSITTGSASITYCSVRRSISKHCILQLHVSTRADRLRAAEICWFMATASSSRQSRGTSLQSCWTVQWFQDVALFSRRRWLASFGGSSLNRSLRPRERHSVIIHRRRLDRLAPARFAFLRRMRRSPLLLPTNFRKNWKGLMVRGRTHLPAC